jgi:UDP-N-acetylglucosamine 2-epimerase (non-hydrolysing)
VEAGLRTYDKYAPFPEEMYRQMVDRVTDMYFAPTEESKQNLLRENVDASKIYVTGNTAIDALKTTIKPDYNTPLLSWHEDKRLILLTAHRRENLGEPMYAIFRAINKIVNEFDDVRVLYPVHLNPAIMKIAEEVFGDNDRVRLISPLEVVDFHNILSKSYIVLTDSGGIQEEAPSLGKPVLVLRNITERPEGVAAGTLMIAGTAEEGVYEKTKRLLTDNGMYKRMSETKNPYGDGFASRRIVDAVLAKFGCV